MPEIDDSPIVPHTKETPNPWRLKTKELAYVHALVGDAAWNQEIAAKLAGFRDDNRHVLRRTINYLHEQVRLNGALSDAIGALAPSELEWALGQLSFMSMASMDSFKSEQPTEKFDEDTSEPVTIAVLDVRKGFREGKGAWVKKWRQKRIVTDKGVEIIDEMIELHDRMDAQAKRAKILGLSAPIRVDHTVSGQITHTHEVRTMMEAAANDPEARKALDLLADRMESKN